MDAKADAAAAIAAVSKEEWVPPGKLSAGGTHYILKTQSTSKGLVVFTHGIGGYYEHTAPVADVVAKHGYTTMCYDNLGMGHSLFPENGETDRTLWTGEGHVKQLHDLLEELQLLGTPYFLCGHSMGGAIATIYTAKYPKEVRGVVLLSPSGVQSCMEPKILPVCALRNVLPSCFVPSIFEGLKRDSRNINNIKRFGDFTSETCAANEAGSRAILKMHVNNPMAIRALFNCARFFPLYSSHAAVAAVAADNVPVLLLHGEVDKTVLPEPTMGVWRKALAGRKGQADYASCVELFAKGAHAFQLEFPDETGARIGGWLDRVVATAGEGRL